MKLLQLIKDFRKWRKDEYNKDLIKRINGLSIPTLYSRYKELDVFFGQDSKSDIWRKGVMFGILYRKEILKKVKI